MTIGIYKIENKVNGKVYIGSSKHIEQRWQEHRKMLKSGKHHSNHLQNSWNIYKEDNFSFSIIEEVKESQDLLKRESFYIEKSNSLDSNYGYNIAPVLDNKHLKIKNPNTKQVTENMIMEQFRLQYYNHEKMLEFWNTNFGKVRIFNDELSARVNMTHLSKELVQFFLNLAGLIKRENIILIDYTGDIMFEGMLSKFFNIDIEKVREYIELLQDRMFLLYWVDVNDRNFYLINPYLICNSDNIKPSYAQLFTDGIGYKPIYNNLKVKKLKSDQLTLIF